MTTTTREGTTLDRDHRPNGLIRFLTLSSFANLGMRDIGLLVLRIGSLALMMHGLSKLSHYSGFIGMLKGNPVGSVAPDLFGFMVVAGQILLPIFLLLGLFTRWCGLLMAILFAFIIFAVNIPAKGMFDAKQGGFTFDASLFYLVPGLALFFLGAGRISVDHMLNKVEDLWHRGVDAVRGTDTVRTTTPVTTTTVRDTDVDTVRTGDTVTTKKVTTTDVK